MVLWQWCFRDGANGQTSTVWTGWGSWWGGALDLWEFGCCNGLGSWIGKLDRRLGIKRCGVWLLSGSKVLGPE
jgi:hypothetical protein